MHYLFIFGTRPEVIKLLPLAEALRGRGERVTLLSTAQHTDLVISAFDAFSMRCDLTLPPLPGERSLSDLVRFFVHHLPSYIHKLAPDAVVVQGDTVSAFSGALCAFLEQIPLIHIEAGLRTYERVSPYPEEALPHAAHYATCNFGLPFSPYLTEEDQDLVIRTVLSAL